MRPGLVGAGAALLALAGLVVASAFAFPAPSGSESARVLTVTLPADGRAATYLWAVNGSDAAVALAWRSTGPTNVSLAPASGCGSDPLACTPATVLVTWNGSAAGAWSASAPPGSEWVLRLANPGASAISVQVTATSAVAAPASVPTWVLGVQVAAAATLGAAGMVAVFLGLFLRPGVYRRPPAGTPPAAPPH